MPLILNIDTATEQASVSLSLDGTVLQERVNGRSMDHATWIHTAIKELVQFGNETAEPGIAAVAVVAGPGSYTGLRVGMATAKGLCYALNLPLISLNTLILLAHATKKDISSSLLVCPMLDARRMEVFTALYDWDLNEQMAPCAMILEKESFSDWLNKYSIIFSGSGSTKWKELADHPNAVFKDVFYTPADIAVLATEAYRREVFAGLAYTEPVYLKEFYSTQKK